ncbi:YdcF family protein [Sphingomonas sp. CD22]|uniref:YdcF family protein n=1 Tax=Sphingomonas sp. CD22 TaxID=3100214 RepID=UPI002AE07316|nr:YdcF family protein [Sphingomonas sp. CD22]MEA1083429.1 YdcF family protein [Sphingomonas sp. CD22]
MIVRLFGLAALAWCLGFAAFMLMLPKPLAPNTTDAIVVPTGGAGRIDRGIALLQARQARRMLVTGVAPGVRPIDLAREYKVPVTLFGCCIDLGADAVDTRSNAEETAAWVKTHDYRTVRLVTSDWHVPRARMELAAAMGPGVQVFGDGVPSTPRLGTLVNEYNKLILRRVALWLGVGA